ncbi:BTB domain-containing protein [Plasmodiophora brassicae]|uniref:BTB domain-containing protein n=1 Tax=Plasmodiophora brassicae TaxID=37360 RepID=A0A0G4IYD0_PLABS|nr:hypothetical protein PBRA_007981 [Plasmodiophora brassicae]SPQ96512.1 unnamed protein product [Plasmodiophora brassicae]
MRATPLLLCAVAIVVVEAKFRIDLKGDFAWSSYHLNDDDTVDVVVEVGERHERFMAHARVLEANVPLFATKSRGPWAEKATDCLDRTCNVFDLSDQDPDAFRMVHGLIYYGSLSVNEDDIPALVRIADYLGMDDVVRQCEKQAILAVDASSSFTFFLLGCRFDRPDLIVRAVVFADDPSWVDSDNVADMQEYDILWLARYHQDDDAEIARTWEIVHQWAMLHNAPQRAIETVIYALQWHRLEGNVIVDEVYKLMPARLSVVVESQVFHRQHHDIARGAGLPDRDCNQANRLDRFIASAGADPASVSANGAVAELDETYILWLALWHQDNVDAIRRVWGIMRQWALLHDPPQRAVERVIYALQWHRLDGDLVLDEIVPLMPVPLRVVATASFGRRRLLQDTFLSRIAPDPVISTVVKRVSRAIIKHVKGKSPVRTVSVQVSTSDRVARVSFGTRQAAVTWTHLYTASVHDFVADAYHKACDGQGKYRVVIVKAENGRIAIGFSGRPSTKDGTLRHPDFLASVHVNANASLSESVEMHMFPCSSNVKPRPADFVYSGPTFSRDLVIGDGGPRHASSRLGTHCGRKGDPDPTSLIGLSSFDVDDYEVYSIAVN